MTDQKVAEETPQQSTTTRKRFRTIAITATIVGVIAASPLGQILYVASMISIIGIPLAFAIGIIPNVAMVIVASYLLWRFVPFFTAHTPLVSLAAACALLLLIPALHNLQIIHHVGQLTARDKADLSLSGNALVTPDQSVALLSAQDRQSLCDQTCLHLLLTNRVAHAFMVPLHDSQSAAAVDMAATRYTLEKRDTCPKRQAARGGARTHAKNFKFKVAGTVSGDYARKLAQGYCLISTKAKLGEADVAFMHIAQDDFAPPLVFSPAAADIKASRSGIYSIKDNTIDAMWQQTVVSYSVLKPVLWSWVKVSAGMSNTSIGWWRTRVASPQTGLQSIAELLRTAGISAPEGYQ